MNVRCGKTLSVCLWLVPRTCSRASAQSPLRSSISAREGRRRRDVSHVLPLCLRRLLVRVHSLCLFGATGEEPRRAAGAAIRREEQTPPARSSWTPGEDRTCFCDETQSCTNSWCVYVWGVAPPLVNRGSRSIGAREHCEETQPGFGDGNVFFGRQQIIRCFNQRTFSLRCLIYTCGPQQR